MQTNSTLSIREKKYVLYITFPHILPHSHTYTHTQADGRFLSLHTHTPAIPGSSATMKWDLTLTQSY